MKDYIYKTIRLLIPPTFRIKIRILKKFFKRYHKERGLLTILFKSRIITADSHLSQIDDYVRQFGLIYSNYRISDGVYYIYPFDPLVERINKSARCGNITADYSRILDSNIDKIKQELEKCNNAIFNRRELKIVCEIENLAKRIANQLYTSRSPRHKELGTFFPNMLYRKPNSFDEALQKILFYNAMFWQMGHYHVGLGRLDYILREYYEADLSKGISPEKLYSNLIQFLRILGRDTSAKSLVLRGDTGQYILLGGVDANGDNVENHLTELFLNAFTELHIPDPKLILRVNSNTSDVVWEKAIQCIMTGIGSPLLMCEDIIMEKMVEFGYNRDDIWNVGTSACWEPLIIGKSFDQNNPFRSVVALKPLNDLLMSGIKFESFDDLYSTFKEAYRKEIESVVKNIDMGCSPLYSLFFDDCISRGKDISEGGAVYSFHGAQVVSFPNTINALLNIKYIVFMEKRYSLEDCQTAIKANFNGFEDLRVALCETGHKFGSADPDVISITNDLIQYTGLVTKKLACNGKPLKIGFSSPNYIEQSKSFDASLDGRRKGEPFAVHISPISSRIDISEILDFSSKLVYSENCINGNVVDFILPSSYLKQPRKLIGIIKDACSKGIFELQLNVMDKATLIDAKAHPEKYPNLIVRVWGFSAYFNDLPEDFKDNLIRRAEIYEVA